MAYPVVRASRIGFLPDPTKRSERPCSRCGRTAKDRRPDTELCQDCLDLAKFEERLARMGITATDFTAEDEAALDAAESRRDVRTVLERVARRVAAQVDALDAA